MRHALRSQITVEEVFEKEEGWYEDLLYDADLYCVQNNLEVNKKLDNYLFLIYPLVIEAKK